MSNLFPTLYKKSESGKLLIWGINVEGNKINITQGFENGKLQEHIDIIKEGKNIGKSNETTPEEQAFLEAKSKFDKKITSDTYKYTREEALNQEIKISNVGGFKPMLAQDGKKFLSKIKYPCYVQPKLDGCLFRTTKLNTDQGLKTIEEIVEHKLKLKVLSFNLTTNKLEYKPVTNWFNNGKINYRGWMDIQPEGCQHIKCTFDHKFLTEGGWKEAQNLDPKKDKVLVNNYSTYLHSLMIGSLLGDSSMVIDKRDSGTSYRLQFSHSNQKLFEFKKNIFGLEGSSSTKESGYGSEMHVFNSNALTLSNFPIKLFYFTGHSKKVGSRKLITYENLKKYITPEALSLWIADDGSLNYNNGNHFTPRLSLHTQSYSTQQLKEFIKYFNNVWDCNPSVYEDKRVSERGNALGKFLTFSTKDTLLILNSLRNKQCGGVEYKYYFPTEGYISKPQKKSNFIKFKKRFSRKMPISVKYDIEVKDNHNYCANDIIVHNCRSLTQKINNEVRMFFRSGKECVTLEKLKNQLTTFMSDGEILDGELYIHGEDFNSFTGAIRANKNLNKEITDKIEYHVYDTPRIAYLNELESFEDRYKMLPLKLYTFNPENIKIVNTMLVNTFSEAMEMYQFFIANGYEGMMFRNIDMPYEQKRSYNLLKWKEFVEDEFIITGFNEGKGKLINSLATFQCKIENGRSLIKNASSGEKIIFNKEDTTFEATPKMTLELRKHYFNNPHEFMGKLLTVKYFELSSYLIPRFPIGKTIRFDI